MTLDIIRATAKEYIEERGLSVITITDKKSPALIEWKTLQKRAIENSEDLFTGAKVNTKFPIYGLGVITGSVNGNLEVIDIDTKNDTKGWIWEDLKEEIENTLPHLLEQFLIVQTVSGGYHIYYRCETIEGNLKLAHNEKGEAILETRGEGGYVVAPPTPNYKSIQGSYSSIPDIAPEERDTLLSICRSLTQYIKPESTVTPSTYSTAISNPEDSPLEAYNKEGASVVIPLLVSHDWKEVERSGERIKLKRPGETTAHSSGDFHIAKNVFKVFSTSTVFDSGKGYSPASVFCILECGGDWKLTYKRLLEQGYGKPLQGEKISRTSIDVKKVTVKSIYNTLGLSGKEVSPLGDEMILPPINEQRIVKINDSEVIASPPWIFEQGEEIIKGEYYDEPNTLKIENIANSKGDIYILIDGDYVNDELSENYGQPYDDPESIKEAFSVIEMAQSTGKKVYVNSSDGSKPKRSYLWQLDTIFNKYIEIQGEKEELSDPEKDSFITELVSVSTGLTGIDRDLYIKTLLENKYISEIGLTRDGIEETIEKIRGEEKTKQLQAQTEQLTKQTQELLSKGKPEEALKLLQEATTKLSKLKTKDFISDILRATSKEDIIAEIRTAPEGLSSGYFLGKIKNGNLSYPEEWLITAGGLTAIAGATNHGKTDFLINTCLNVSRNYPEKKFIYLTYEQSRRDIFLRFLNSFSDIDITSTRSNVRAIKNYYKYGEVEKPIALDEFQKKEAQFYTDYIDSKRLIIKQVSYNSEDINSTIEQLCKEDSSIGGFFIDYYQKLELPKDNKKRESRVEELKEIGQRLNDLCIKTGIPIVLGAQFNRKVMSPEDMFPQNIGEAGDIERILDTLIAIWNTSKKLRKHEKEEGNTLEEKGIARYEGTGEFNGKNEIKKLVGIPGRLYIEVLKSRDTETGLEALLDYNGKLGSIKNQQESKSNF
jgi:hypothetical protein